MSDFQLGMAESRFAEIIWEKEPLSSGELVKLSEEKLGWKKSTTYTVLKKLCEQGLFLNENAVVTAVVSREDYLQSQGEQFVEKAFGGSLPRMIAAFIEHKRLSRAQIEEIEQMIEEYKGEE